jgi:hypothetical protein
MLVGDSKGGLSLLRWGLPDVYRYIYILQLRSHGQELCFAQIVEISIELTT